MTISKILLMLFQVQTLLFTQQEDQTLIETTCKNTPNYKLCVSTVNASPKTATDVEGLGLIMVDAIKTKAVAGLSIIDEHNFLHPEGTDELQTCTNTYLAVVKADVPEAVAGLTRGVPKFAEFGMIDAKWEAEICEWSLEKTSILLSETNKDVKDLAGVAVAIIRNLL